LVYGVILDVVAEGFGDEGTRLRRGSLNR